MNVRNLFGLFTWLFSSNPDAKECGNKVTLSADGSSTAYLLSRVQRIGFKGTRTLYVSSSIEIYGSKEDVYVYPEPVSKSFYVNGVDEDDTDLIIYDKNGRCLCAEYGNEIDIFHLQEGTYYLGIDDYYIRFNKK